MPAWLSVNTVLVGVGALLLAVAAIGFLIFSWQSMPLAGRAAVIGGITLTAIGVATWLRPRLPETAEAVGGLSVVLVLGDAWAIRSTGLFGADRGDGVLYAGTSFLVIGLLGELWGRTSKIRSGTHAAAFLLPVGALLVVNKLQGDWDPAGTIALLVAALATMSRRTLPQECHSERWVSRGMAGVLLVTAAVSAWGTIDALGLSALATLAVAAGFMAQTWADAPTDEALAAARARRQAPGQQTPVPQASAQPSLGQNPQGENWQSGNWQSQRPQGQWPQGAKPNVATSPYVLNRAWSLAGGFTGAVAATIAGAALADVLNLTNPARAILLTVVPGLLLVAVSLLTPAPKAALRRTAVALGVLAMATLVALPGPALALWQVLRPLQDVPRSEGATTRLEDVGVWESELLQYWATTLACLAIIAVVVWAAGRRKKWPVGPWPRSVHRVLNQLPLPLAAATVVVAVFVPAFAAVTTVAALLVLSLVSVVLALRSTRIEHRVLFWVAGCLVGTVAIALSWVTEELPGVTTALAAVAFLLARRRTMGDEQNGPVLRAVLVVLAACAVPASLIVLADQAGAGGDLPLIWAALICGLGTAAFYTLPGLPVPPRPGRAPWTALDRMIGAVPGMALLGIACLRVVDAPDDFPAWTEPSLLAMALAIALAGAFLIRPVMSEHSPLWAPVFAAVSTPLIGLLAISLVDAWSLQEVSPGLVWAMAAAVGTIVTTLLTIGGRLDSPRLQERRLGAEFGLALTGVIALAVSLGDDRLWLTLIIVGASAAAISLTPDRGQVGWVAGVLLTGSSWLRLVDAEVELVEAFTVPPALVLLAVQLWADRRTPPAQSAPTSAQQPGARVPLPLYDDLGILARPLSIGVIPSVIACAVVETPVRPIALLALGGLLVAGSLYALRAGRFPGQPRTARALMVFGMLGAVGAALARVIFELNELGPMADDVLPMSMLEVWTVPAALILLAHGLDRFQRLEDAAAGRRPDIANSWAAFGPGLALLIVPGLLCTLTEVDGPILRPALVLLAGGLSAWIGGARRMQAVLIIGAGTLTAQALILLAPWMWDVGRTVPLWAWAAVIGLTLLVLGGGYERRLAQLRTARSRLAALR